MFTPKVVGGDVDGGHSNCGSVTPASRFLIGLPNAVGTAASEFPERSITDGARGLSTELCAPAAGRLLSAKATPYALRSCRTTGRRLGVVHQAAPAGCLVAALSRLNRLVVATHRTKPASCFSSKSFATSSHTSSGTGSVRSAIRVIDSARAKAALSASLKKSVSRHAATAKSRSSLSPTFLALIAPL